MTPHYTLIRTREGYNLAEKHDYGQVDIPRMRAGHVSGMFLSIWPDPDRYTPTEAIRRALDQIDAVRLETARRPGTWSWRPRPAKFWPHAGAGTSRY